MKHFILIALVPMVLTSCQSCPRIALRYAPPSDNYLKQNVPKTVIHEMASGKRIQWDGHHEMYRLGHRAGWERRVTAYEPIKIGQSIFTSPWGFEAGYRAADRAIGQLIARHGKACVRKALGPVAVPDES